MSPIEKPSTLDLMDTTVSANLSLDQSFFHPTVDTENLPKVSTMKVPQGLKMSDAEMAMKLLLNTIMKFSGECPVWGTKGLSTLWPSQLLPIY